MKFHVAFYISGSLSIEKGYLKIGYMLPNDCYVLAAAVEFVFFRQGVEKAPAEAFEDAEFFGNFYQTGSQGRSGYGED